MRQDSPVTTITAKLETSLKPGLEGHRTEPRR